MNRTLLYGFGGLLALIAVSGLAAIQMIERLDQRQHAYRANCWTVAGLAQVREAVTSLAPTPHYLFDPGHSGAADSAMLHALETETENALARCQPLDVLSSLHGEIKTYWKVLWLMLEWPNGTAQGRRQLLLWRTDPTAHPMLSIADRAADLLNQESAAEQQHFAALTRDYRRQAIVTLVLILAPARRWCVRLRRCSN